MIQWKYYARGCFWGWSMQVPKQTLLCALTKTDWAYVHIPYIPHGIAHIWPCFITPNLFTTTVIWNLSQFLLEVLYEICVCSKYVPSIFNSKTIQLSSGEGLLLKASISLYLQGGKRKVGKMFTLKKLPLKVLHKKSKLANSWLSSIKLKTFIFMLPNVVVMIWPRFKELS